MAGVIPVYGKYDLIVVGGASGGVAAALGTGGSCYLGAAETYLGEDICGAGRLDMRTAEELSAGLARKIFLDQGGLRREFLEPLAVKAVLEESLLDAGVSFEFGVVPIALLEDSKGIGGVVFSGKGGTFAVLGRNVVDATSTALLARLAGVSFTNDAAESKIAFSRTLIGEFDLTASELRTLGRIRIKDTDGVEREWTVCRKTIEVDIPSLSPTAIAEVEDRLRTETWSPGIVWAAPRIDWIPFDRIAGDTYDCASAETVDLRAFATSIAGLYVLSPCAALSRAAAAEIFLDASRAICIGSRLGGSIEGGATVSGKDCVVRGGTGSVGAMAVRAFNDGGARDTVELTSAFPLPDLGAFDVVVVGGGTGGGAAAVAAARSGAKTLLLESQYDLGGIGTLGAITSYYFGNRDGFTREMTRGLYELDGRKANFNEGTPNAIHKGEWLRREIRKASGEIWFGAVGFGTICEGKRVCGVQVYTANGVGTVRAKVVVDATGSADIAFAAGCECVSAAECDLAIQGAGLPPQPIPPRYRNTDYTFINDNDFGDVTRAMIVARRRFRADFDLSPIPGTRERRQIVGDVTVTAEDVFTERTWCDSICRCRSDFDSHGYTVAPIFHVRPPDDEHYCYNAWLPLRALLPRKYSGILVTGLAISVHRDAMPIFRMQTDIQNHAYSAGLAASAAALGKNGEVRRIDVRVLQRGLISSGPLTPAILLHIDEPTLPRQVLQSAASGSLWLHSEIAALMMSPQPARLLLRQRLTSESNADIRLRCAKLLAALGDNSGTDLLIARLDEADGWDDGWNYTGMGQYGASESELDACIQLLALARIGSARNAVLKKARELPAKPDFSHVRAVSDYAATFRDSEIGEALAELLRSPEIGGHDWRSVVEELEDIPESTTDTQTRNRVLIELSLAAGLCLCGDTKDKLGETVLRKYALDIRGYFARYARATLVRKISAVGGHGFSPHRSL